MTTITREELLADDGSAIIGHIADDPNAVGRDVQGKLRDFINIMDFHVGSGNDLTDALEKLIYAAFPTMPALQIFIPEGNYVVTRQIIPARQVSIRGAGIFATVLDFHNVGSLNGTMQGAISFGLKATIDEYEAGTYGEASKVIADPIVDVDGRTGSDYSSVEDLTIKISGSRPSGFDYGLWSAARLFARNVAMRYCGAKLTAGDLLSTDGFVVGNANLSELHNCHAIEASQHGFMFDGTDANACKIVGCNAFLPEVYGFYDCGFLGNTYLGCHADGGGTASRAYVVDSEVGNNRSSFIGCYAEGLGSFVDPAWNVLLPAVIIAPQGELPVPSFGVNGVIAGSHAAGFAIGGQLDFVANLIGYSFGDSTHPATRVFTGGMVIRGQGDGHEYWMIGKDTGNITGGGNGVSVIKRLNGTDTKYELIHFGDTRHRPAFPRGLVATLPTYANNSAATGGGLTAGEVYKTATGEVRIVV
jgi:hypothetical protein